MPHPNQRCSCLQCWVQPVTTMQQYCSSRVWHDRRFGISHLFESELYFSGPAEIWSKLISPAGNTRARHCNTWISSVFTSCDPLWFPTCVWEQFRQTHCKRRELVQSSHCGDRCGTHTPRACVLFIEPVLMFTRGVLCMCFLYVSAYLSSENIIRRDFTCVHPIGSFKRHLSLRAQWRRLLVFIWLSGDFWASRVLCVRCLSCVFLFLYHFRACCASAAIVFPFVGWRTWQSWKEANYANKVVVRLDWNSQLLSTADRIGRIVFALPLRLSKTAKISCRFVEQLIATIGRLAQVQSNLCEEESKGQPEHPSLVWRFPMICSVPARWSRCGSWKLSPSRQNGFDTISRNMHKPCPFVHLIVPVRSCEYVGLLSLHNVHIFPPFSLPFPSIFLEFHHILKMLRHSLRCV